MDLIGDIVEHEAIEPTVPVMPEPSGFPARRNIFNKKKSPSRFRAQASKKVTPNEPVSEAERIHEENMKKLSLMTLEEIAREREELLQNLDPKLVQSLLMRTEKRIHRETDEHDQDIEHQHKHAEGYNEWIGNTRTEDGWKDLTQLDKNDVNKALGIEDEPKVKSNKIVKFAESEDVIDELRDDPNTQIISQTEWQDVDDINELIPEAADVGEDGEIAHKDYQLVHDEEDLKDEVTVHFPKPKSLDDMDEDDPGFFDKLHTKYFPDLPKETEKLSWMTQQTPTQTSTTYESILDMRYDFKGNLVELVDESTPLEQKEIPTHLGLHHHGKNPQQAGYTLSELAHLGRSLFPGQRCISFLILGRILHKLGKHKYNIVPVTDDDENNENDEYNANVSEMNSKFEKLMWDLIQQLRIIDTLEEAADESKTKNLSVRNYAVEALWLWRSGGGQSKSKPELNEDDEIMQEIIS